MSELTTDVASDTWIGSAHASRTHGDDEDLRLKSGEAEAYLWWKQPWDREATVVIGSQVIRLTAKGASTGSRTLTGQGTTKRFDAAAITWSDGRPAVAGSTYTEAIGTLADGEIVELDVTGYAEAVVGGRKNTGIRLSTDAGTLHRFYSADSEFPPQVVTVWTEVPDAPTIVPAGGIIGVSKPIIGLDYDEDDGDLGAVRVEVDATGDLPEDFDSAAVPSTVAQLALASTAFGGFAAAATKYLRGTVTVGGVESDFSDWVPLTYQPKHSVVIDSPALGEVTSPTPVVLAHIVPGFVGETLTKYRTRIYDASRTTLLFDSLEQPATDDTDIAVDVPESWRSRRVLQELGVTYSLYVQAWGDEDRVSTIGVPDYAEAWADFVVTDGEEAAPTGFTVTPIEGQPGLAIDFTIAPDAPDGIVIAAEDRIVANLEPEDAFVSGTAYSWFYDAAPPQQPVEVKVAKVVDGVMSPWAGPVTATAVPRAVWLIDSERGLKVQLWGVDVENWRYTDQGAEYDPEGSPCFVHVITSQRGASGELTGKIKDVPGLTHDDQVEAFWKMKARRDREVQLVTGRFAFPVRLKDAGLSMSKDHRSQAPASLARFRFDQTGGLPFTTRLD